MENQKSVLVTGASSGIGYATSLEFAKRGYLVFAGARPLDRMKDLEKYGIIPIQLDVSSPESINKAKEFISEKTGGRLNVLYNNAGQSCTFPALDLNDELIRKCYEVNVFGPMILTRVFSPLLIKAKGVVGFTGSVSAILPFPFSGVYSSTKAAIHLYASVLELELSPFGVKVINFVTGGVATDIADTRPLPDDSIYREAPGIEEALLERQQMAKRNKPITAEAYAKKVVSDFERLKIGGPLNIYRGKQASFLAYVSCLVPRFILKFILIRKFKLLNIFRFLQEKYSGRKMHKD